MEVGNLATQIVKLEDVNFKYTCAAYPPDWISMNSTYKVLKDDNGIGFTNGVGIIYAELWFIKMLFTPTNSTWEKVEGFLK